MDFLRRERSMAQQAEGRMSCRRRNGEVLPVESPHQPTLQTSHRDFASLKHAAELRPDFRRLEQGETVAAGRVANDNISARCSKLVGKPLNLIHAVRFMIHRHDERKRGVEGGQNCGKINVGNVVEAQIGTSSALSGVEASGRLRPGCRAWPNNFAKHLVAKYRNGRLARRQAMLREQFGNGSAGGAFLPQFDNNILWRKQILEFLRTAGSKFRDRLADCGWVK